MGQAIDKKKVRFEKYQSSISLVQTDLNGLFYEAWKNRCLQQADSIIQPSTAFALSK
jgi:hypothetical protein